MRKFLYVLGGAGAIVILYCLIQLLQHDTLAYQPQGAPNNCPRQPAYVQQAKFSQPAFDTGRRGQPGLTLIDLQNPNATPYQMPSWKKFGDLGAIARDENAYTYSVNVPSINTLNTNAENHLAILRVDPQTGEMTTWLTLKGAATSKQNYYGIMGLSYDCDNHLLYASSVAGSTPEAEKGFIAVIDVKAGKEIYRYQNIDAIGMAIYGSPHGRYLYAGLARNASVVKIKLTSNGKPFGKPEQVLQFDPLNQTRVRTMTFNSNKLTIKTTEFYYTLLASTELETAQYTYQYNANKDLFSPVRE